MSERAEACVMTIKGRMLTTVKKQMATLLMRMLTRMVTRFHGDEDGDENGGEDGHQKDVPAGGAKTSTRRIYAHARQACARPAM